MTSVVGTTTAREDRIAPTLESLLPSWTRSWVPGEKSPDRMDALVWAMSRLFYPQKDDPDQIIRYDDGMVRISSV